MAIIDLIGVPFPASHAEFSERSIQIRLAQIESYIEIGHDIRQVTDYLFQLKRCLENEETLRDVGFEPMALCEGVASAAVVLYAKLFVASQGRTKLDEKSIFKESGLESLHTELMELRHKFYAHHEFNANQHQIFVFPVSSESEVPKLNPSGQTTRVLIAKSVDWELYSPLIEFVSNWVKGHIFGLCKSIESKLTKEQKRIINQTPKNELFDNYWRENPEMRKNPFTSRTKT